MRFFNHRKEETAALNSFRESCVKDRLEIVVSRRAIASLNRVVSTKQKRLAAAAIGTSAVLALSRRGLIREEADGLWVATELGLLALAYAEAGGLLEDRRVGNE